jgi:hypothetical protein
VIRERVERIVEHRPVEKQVGASLADGQAYVRGDQLHAQVTE